MVGESESGGGTVKNRILTRSGVFFSFFPPHYSILQIKRVEIIFEKRFTVKLFRCEGVKFRRWRKVKSKARSQVRREDV